MANDAWYTKGRLAVEAQTLDLLGNDIKMVLLTDIYTFSQAHEFMSQLVELSVTGYSRKVNNTDFTLSRVEDQVSTPDAVRYPFDANVVFAALAAGETIGGVALIKDTGNDATSPVIAHWGVSPGVPTNGGDVTITVDTVNGNLIVDLPVAA